MNRTTYGEFRRDYLYWNYPDWVDSQPKEEITSSVVKASSGDKITANPYYLHKSRVIFPQGTMSSVYYRDSGCLHNVSPIGVPSLAEFDDDSLFNKVLNKTVDSLKGRDDSGHDLLVSVFESPELIDLYKQVKENLSYLKSNKFLKVLGKAHPAIIASEYYLLWTFGIAPLIGAMEEIMQTFNKGFSLNEKIKSTSYMSDSIDTTYPLSGFDGECEYNCTFTKRYVLGCGVGIEDINALIRSQFGLTTPGSAYYATLPMSFVLDWFIDIGGYLNTLESLASFTGYKISNTYLTSVVNYESTLTAKGTYRRSGGDREWVTMDIVAQKHSFEMRRIILGNTLPSPPLPSFKPRLSGGKIASLFALATQLLFKK